MFIDKLDDIVNKYNNTFSAIKMKPVVNLSACIDIIIKKILNLKLVIQNTIKAFLQKVTFWLQIGLKKF